MTVTSLGGVTGAIALGGNLTIGGSTLNVTASLLNMTGAGFGVASLTTGASVDVQNGGINLVVTNPTLLTGDPAFPNPGDPPNSSYKGMSVDVTYNSGAAGSQKGHALAATVTVESNAPSGGASLGVIGAFLNKKLGTDGGGVLGYVNNDQSVSTASGVGVWGLVRGTTNDSGNGVDALRATSETASGSHPHAGLFVSASQPADNAFRKAVWIQGAAEYGVLIGGDMVGPIPTHYLTVLDTSNNTVLDLTGTGNLLVGTNTLSVATKGFHATAAGSFDSIVNSPVTSTMGKLDNDGSVLNFTRNGSSVVGSVTLTTTSTSYNTTSDGRLKTRLRPLESGTALDRLNVYAFDWKDHPGRSGAGVVAQEAYEIYPHAVTPGDNGVPGDTEYRAWQVDYSQFVPLLLAEVKALRQRMSELEAERTALAA